MCHLLSHYTVKPATDAPLQSKRNSVSSTRAGDCFSRRAGATLARNLGSILFLWIVLISSSFGQIAIPTSRANNSRTSSNTSETLLTPSNVNKSTFGRLFSTPVDYVVMAQPLYVPNVFINGQTHNVVYVVTQADSVYAIDADDGTQLWYASMLNGGTTASGKYLPCGTAPGFYQEGIIGTPAIDPNTNTMYLVAKTLLGTTVRHHLHALNIADGTEQQAPTLIAATSTSNRGHKTVFNSLHEKNRPGLLLLNGILYIGFGSNYCNDSASGWVLSYDPSTLTQLASFNASPDQGLASIWQAGSGLAGDSAGNIYVETAEAPNNGYDIQNGGQTYCNSVIKLSPNLTIDDYFTPYSVAFLNSHDLDLSSTGALVLPDQDGPYPHELIAGGKQGFIYVLNRDNMGMYSVNDSQVLQEIDLVPGTNDDVLFGSPAYWNHTVYFAANSAPLMAFPLSGGLLGTPVKTASSFAGSHSPSISANGNTNGILWVINGGLSAFDAVSMKPLYNSNGSARDKLPLIGHFVSQTVANGKVYVATQNSLEAYGLLHGITVTGGNSQSAPAATALSAPITVQVANPYNGQPDVGATVTFSDGCTKAGSATCGTFNPGNGNVTGMGSVTTDPNGNAIITYTVPQKAGTYTLTATLTIGGTASGSTTTTATATAGLAARLIAYGGGGQTGSDGFSLANPIIAQVQDTYKNPVAGFTIYFTATKGVPNPASVATDAGGFARTSLQLPSTPSSITVSAAAPALQKVNYAEHSVAAVATKIAITSGNSQSAAAGTQLPQALNMLVTDQYGNPFSGNSITFSDGGAGGTFPQGNTAVTGADGTATQSYTLPTIATAVYINAAATGISSPAVFSETSVAGAAANATVASGNNQSAPNGSQLPQTLSVLVTDQYGNAVSGVSVAFSDGGAGGAFSNGNTVVTDSGGTANQFYTLPAVPNETVYINATAAGVSNPALFIETGQ